MVEVLGVVCAPPVVSGEADVVPAQRPDMSEQFVWHVDAAASKRFGGGSQIDSVPEDDGGDDEVAPGGSMLLVVVGAIVHLAQPVQEHGPGEVVAGLALIQASLDAMAQLRFQHPLQGEDAALDAADFRKGGGEGALPAGGRQRRDGVRGAHLPGSDGCGELDELRPGGADLAEARGASDQRGQRRRRRGAFEHIEPDTSKNLVLAVGMRARPD